MRREELYLRDIVEAAGHIADFIAGLEFSHLNDLLRKNNAGSVMAGKPIKMPEWIERHGN